MVAFFLVIIMAAAALAIFALMSSKKGGDNEREQEKESLNNHFVRSELTLKMEEQINSLNVELERLKTEHEQVRAELTLANELASNLKYELDKNIKSDKAVEQAELEKLKNDNTRLRDELYKKGKELEKQAGDYNNKIEEYKTIVNKLEETVKQTVPKQEYHQINDKCFQLSAEFETFKNKSIPKEDYEALTRKAAEAESRIGSFNNENQDLINKIKILESEINEHNKEILRQKGIILEHEQAKEHAAKREKELEIFKQDKSDLENKIKMLESQISEYNKEIEKQNEIISQRQKDKAAGGVSKEQYEELKNKLEKAEEVLRMLHGAGA